MRRLRHRRFLQSAALAGGTLLLPHVWVLGANDDLRPRVTSVQRRPPPTEPRKGLLWTGE